MEASAVSLCVTSASRGWNESEPGNTEEEVTHEAQRSQVCNAARSARKEPDSSSKISSKINLNDLQTATTDDGAVLRFTNLQSSLGPGLFDWSGSVNVDSHLEQRRCVTRLQEAAPGTTAHWLQSKHRDPHEFCHLQPDQMINSQDLRG